MSGSVIVISHYSYPGGSAASLRILNMVEGFLENNIKVHVIAPYYRPSRRSGLQQINKGDIKEHYVFADVKTPRLYNDFKYKTRVSGFIFNVVKEVTLKEKVVLVYIYDGTSFLYFNKVTRYILSKNIPLTFDITEYRDHNFKANKKLSMKERISNMVLYPDYLLGKNFILRRASFFISISTLLKEYLLHYKRPVIVIPGFEKFAPLNTHVDKSGSKVSFLYVGTLIDRDAPEILELLLKECIFFKNNLQFKFIGKYNRIEKSREIMNRWENQFKDLVVSLGEVDESKIAVELLNCDVFILTRKDSYEERCAFPTRLAEYLALKKPVLVSAVGDIKVYLRDEHDACYIEQSGSHQLTDKTREQITKLVRDKSFRDFVGTNGHIKGKKYFDSIQNARVILEMATTQVSHS